MNHRHWTILCYTKYVEEGAKLLEAVEVTVNDALNESDAIRKAKRSVKRKHYELRKVWECNQCQVQTRLQKKVEKLVDKQIRDNEI